ncbi:MAG: gliding motility-associated C-terminal domain-containing protein [Bacteroidota bacterium]
MLKKLLLFVILFTACYLNAQTLYWVGGSGYWNDSNHWSLTSGGSPANKTPNAQSTVIFDNQSANEDFAIHVLQNTEVGAVYAQNQFLKGEIISSSNVQIKINGAVDLGGKFYLNTNGPLLLNPLTDCIFRFSPYAINSDVKIYSDKQVIVEYLNTTKNIFISGNIKLSNSVLISNNIYFSNSLVQLKNSFFQTSTNVSFTNSSISSDLHRQSRFICKENNLSASTRSLLNSTGGITVAKKMTDCVTVAGTPTNVSCNATCDGIVVFDMSACATPAGPYDIQWLNTNAACQTLPPAETAFVGTTYSLSTVCDCVTPYIVIFTNNTTGEQSFPQALVGKQPKPLLNITSINPNCFNKCDGQIRVQILSGTSPININYNPPNLNHGGIIVGGRDTLFAACAVTHTIVATGSDGCINTFTRTLIQPTQLFANGSSSSVTCNGVCNGSATSAPTGGTFPYTYSWIASTSTPSTAAASTIGGLCPGVVTMTVTDSKTCTATFSTTITQPPAVTLTVTRTNLVCGSLCNGSATVSAIGGIANANTYSWTPSGGSGPVASNLCTGNYTCTVTNNGNCVKTITVAITSPPTLTATPTQTNLACNGTCIGAINLNPSGGTAPRTFVWSPLTSTSSVVSSLCAGIYSYTITDNAFCTYSNSVTITQPPATTLTMSQTDVICNGACNGTATGNMGGGTSPYTYSWTPGAPTNSTVTNLCPGTYTLKATDSRGCFSVNTVTITQPLPLAVNVTSISPTCNGICNGSIDSNPTGGTAPYTFTLQSTGAPVTSNPPFINLCAGSYTVVVKDALGCSKTQTVNLTQPNPVTLSLNPTQNNCFNQCNATIATVVNGGTPTFTFLWSNGSTGSSLSNLCSGAYSSTVTDVNGCKAIASVTVTSKPDLTVSIVPTNPGCDAQCTGIATASVSGGSPNYTINWNNGGIGNSISNLCQGDYTATVTDFFGCIKTQTVSIIAPPALTLTATNGTVSCAGSCDGAVSVVPTGGTAGYFYSWNSTPGQNTPTAGGLCAGNYIVNVTDANGCLASIAASVAQPAVLTASIGNVQPSCNVCIGAATASGIGGTPPYSYSWSGGQNIPSPANLCVGPQTVIVTDSKGCTTTQTVQINPTVITVLTTNGSTLTCNGQCSGVATANPSGGAGGYTYTWTPSVSAPLQNTQSASGLCAGTHTVRVSDSNGCSSTNTVSFSNPPAITLTVNQTNVSCNGFCNGTASATATGGTGIKTYNWLPGGFTTPSISGLCAGDYTVTATDFNNCSQTQVVTIVQTNSLTASFTFTNPSTCTSTDGAIQATVSDGTAPYTYTWTPGGPSNPLTNLGSGTYSLNITDALGCTQTIVTTLNNPTGPTVTVTSNSITCFGSCTGTATLSITGNGPFQVNGVAIASNTAALSGLCAGINIPVVTDAITCVTNQTVSILEPTQLTTNGVVVNDPCNASCNGVVNLTPTGGTAPYSYTWSPSGLLVEDPSNLCAGNHTVIISDGNSCLVTNSFVVTEPLPLTLSFNKKDVLCNSGCTGSVRAIVGGGTSPYTYTWTSAAPFVTANIDTIVNICSGIYTVNASDANGCVITGTVDIGQPIALTSTITSVNEKCNGQCTGSAFINASGGTLPYSYNYNTTPVTPTQAINSLCIGTYTGTVIDANGCQASASFIITEPLSIVVTTTVSNPLCNSVCNGSVATTVTGGNPNYNYNWIPNGGPVANPTGLCAGNYTLIVTDDSLCTGQAVVVLIDPPALIANTSFTNPTCFGGCDGAASATPIGGTAPFNYAWMSPAFSTQTVTNLCAGDYTVTVTDAKSCQSIQTLSLINPPAITLNAATTPATCGFNDGSINAVPSSGIPPYTYNWLPPVPLAQNTNTVVSNLGAGVYTVIVTDGASCSNTISIALSNSNGPGGATITSTNVSCMGLCNGAAEVSNPFGGTPPYAMSWIGSVPASSVITGLCAGLYTAQLIDANNCVFFQPATILQPQVIDDNEVFTIAACLGNCTGAIALNPTGGNGGYTYAWSPSTALTGTITNICPGVHTATITDVLGCTLVSTYNLPSLTTITSSTFATNNTCFGNCNGSILATNIAGGLPQYTFSWTDPSGQTSSTATGLCNGNYSVTITDANGCFNVFPATITSPSAITYTPTVTQPACGLCDGSAVVNPTGGTPGYTYIWSAANQTGNTATNLCGGVYDLQVTDGNGCESISSVVVNNSSTFTGETITSKNVSCNGVCDGTVSVTAIGGASPITYNWLTPSSSSQSLVGLCAGTYFCNMTDANGCVRTASVVIGSTTTLTLTPQVTQSSCSSNTGSITVSVMGGGGSYTYAWLPAGSTGTLTNLAPGNYTLTVSDGNCSQTQIYSINSINGPSVASIKQDVSCSGLCDGSISLSISGGTPNYTTLWSNGLTTPSINGLCAGPYSYTITDAAGCKAVQNFSLEPTAPIVFSLPDLDNPTCNNNCNGVITTIPSGGALPYTYSWIVSTSTTSVANNLCSGNYSVSVSDANGCSSSQTYTLTGPSTISVTAVVTDLICNAVPSGAIDLTVGGGTPGYTYTWTPGPASTQDLTNLSAGTYSVLISDGNGCLVDSSFIVNEPAAINDNEVIGSSACFGNCTGSVSLSPTGGTGVYSYSWNPSASTATVTNLCPGPLTATITDALGCTFVANYNVPSITTITASTQAVNNNCFTDCNGVLTATNIAGGLPPFTLQWNDPLGQPGNTAIGLCTGTYSVKITDSNGCFNMIPATVGSPSQVTFTPVITAPGCDQCNGSVAVNPVGGTSGYTYLWTNNQNVSTATNLCAGAYGVQITDGNGCMNTTTVIVNSSSGITSESITFTDVTCGGTCDGTANVTAVGGVLPISYSWIHNGSVSQSQTGLCAGTYFCNMTDANGCSRTASVVIGAATNLTVSSQVSQSSCSANTGSITVNASGGSGSYTYVWTPVAPNTATLTNLATGVYTLTVSDGSCSKTQVFTLQSVNAPIITSIKKDLSCSGVCDGSIGITVSGGMAPLSTLWSNALNTNTINALCAGSYSVKVTDATGCIAIRNFSLDTLPSIFFSTPDLDSPLCNNACDGSLTVIPVGGALPYTFTWTPGNLNTATNNGLCSGIFSITVKDMNGCSASNSYSLSNPTPLILTATITDATCSSAPDGAITTTVSGGTPGYTTIWTPGNSSSLINVLSGPYTVTVTDANGCILDSAFIINSIITVNAIAGNDTLFCQNGTLFLDGSSSSSDPGTTYQWLSLPSNTVVAGTLITSVSPPTGTNTFVLVATDGTGFCIDRDSIIVTSNPLPNVDAGPMVSIPVLSSAQIGGSPTGPTGSTFNWTPLTALDNPTATNPTSGTTITTVYTVTVVDVNGCSNSDTVTVYVYPEVIIPNGFSPNGDGKNDVWQIDFIDQFPECEVEVYNRWGEQLFYSKGYTVPFNGQYKGKDLPVGTYYYIINLNHPSHPDAFTSPLTIFR